MELKQFKTESGFEFEVDPEVMDDSDIFDLLMAAHDGDQIALRKAYVMILGDEQFAKAKEFIREESGKAKESKLMELLNECFEALGNKGKNS